MDAKKHEDVHEKGIDEEEEEQEVEEKKEKEPTHEGRRAGLSELGGHGER